MKHVIGKNNVTERGDGDRTIVFAHGFGTDKSACMQALYSALYAYAYYLPDICHSFQQESVNFAGYSVSGMVGLLGAIERPDLFENMVFIGASPEYPGDDGYKGVFTIAVLEALYGTMKADYFAWPGGFASLVRQDHDWQLSESLTQILSAMRSDAALAEARINFESNNRNDISKMDKKNLFIYAVQNIAESADERTYLKRYIKNNRLVKNKDAGHLPHINAPLLASSEISVFFNSNPKERH